ncbi:MAG: glycosyltransferase family 2 protein [Limisphaerales bacterium]
MIPVPSPKITAIIPIFGSSGDLGRLIENLNRQTLKPSEIIVVDSSPKSLDNPPVGVRYFKNPNDIGLGGDINFGAQFAGGDFLLIVQQDCLPESDCTIEKLFEALTPDRVAATCTVNLPREIWERYNFWGKILMSRWIGDVQQGVSDKFDLMRTKIFRKINGYDTVRFTAGGQDMDLYMRLSQQGKVYIHSARVLHLHNQSKKTSGKEVFTKHFQLAESFGALFRKWGLQLRRAPYAGHWSHHLAKYLYPLLIVFPLAPKTVGAGLLILTNLTNLHVWRVKSPKTLIMLFLNPLLFLVGAIGTARGLLYGRQRFSQDK